MTTADEQLSFSVDTHLLRELGALLVGRDSTAALELVKNSYDADATKVTLHGEGLGEPDGRIVISDDGNGMTFDRFRDAFLRIAGRTKEERKSSPRYQRRYTGAKGIGRLAAHKLAAVLQVESTPRVDLVNESPSDTDGVSAMLEWDRMEQERRDLTSLGDTLRAHRISVPPEGPFGTTLTLTGIRTQWTKQRLGPFLEEMRNCRPPDVLVEPLPDTVVDETLLFGQPRVREHGRKDPGFSLDLTGDFEGGDDLWQVLAQRADWILEIDSSSTSVSYAIAPTVRKRRSVPAFATDWVRAYQFAGDHPDPTGGPHFQSRILITEGSLGPARSQAPLARAARRDSGIRVFMEGFRVLPYGTPGDDWLQLDRDYVRRPREFEIDVDSTELPQIENEGFFQLGNRAFFGAVLLTEKGAPNLSMVVNREGFVPDEYFLSLRNLVRAGVDLSVRVRAALERRITAEEKQRLRNSVTASSGENARRPGTVPVDESAVSEGRGATADSSGDEGAAVGTPSPDTVSESASPADPGESARPRRPSLPDVLAVAREAVSALRSESLPEGVSARATVDRLSTALAVLSEEVAQLRDEQVTLRTLAGVGTQYAAFVHEVNGMLGQAQAVRDILDRILADESFTRQQRSRLRQLRDAADELAQSLARQTSYLTEVVGADARRRRRRLNVAERLQSTLRLLQPRLARNGQHLRIDVPDDLRTPPLFPAELAIIFTNLLTNAIKFAGRGGTVAVRARTDDRGRFVLTVENTGTAVAPEDRERFFRPFESNTVDVDAVLGQGMGLGLPIVLSLASDYDGDAYFIDPPPQFATAVQVTIPDPRPTAGRPR